MYTSKQLNSMENEFLLEVMSVFWNWIIMILQLWEYAKNFWIIPYELYLNKATLLKTKRIFLWWKDLQNTW